MTPRDRKLYAAKRERIQILVNMEAYAGGGCSRYELGLRDNKRLYQYEKEGLVYKALRTKRDNIPVFVITANGKKYIMENPL